MIEKVGKTLGIRDGHNEKNFERLADLQLLQEKFHQARITLDHLLYVNPNNGFANYEMAYLLSRNPQSANKARALFKKAEELGYGVEKQKAKLVA